jgi:hypothetical protein
MWRVLTKAASRVGSGAIKCSSNIVNAHVHLLAQDDGRQVSRIVRVICKILVEHTDKWRIEEIIGGPQKWQQVALPDLTISPFYLFFLSEFTDNVETSFDIERSTLPFWCNELTEVARTVGGERRVLFHQKGFLRTFYKHVVGHKKNCQGRKIFGLGIGGKWRKREEEEILRKKI